MKNENNLLWKVMVLLCSAFLVTACLTDDNDDGEGNAQTQAEIEQDLVGIWVGECTANPDAGGGSFAASRTQLEFKPDGTAINSGVEYSDASCDTKDREYGPNNATFTIGAVYNTANFNGFEFNFISGSDTKYQIITEVIADPDNGDEFFFLGLETEALDGSTPETRPDTYDQNTRFYKTSLGITTVIN